MSDNLDVDLHDRELIDEIELVTELMVLASEASSDLDQDTIDAVLGLGSARRRTPIRTVREPFIPAQRAV